ncbi:metalloregulator ArsR/SmtB family transcription factor [Ornithinimicrobium sp. INDO-MA30-4]|uniref:helix-turn-helix transcriptional regulator n=1 Tax=Ornithinimicrobium sp. INDO-MA30-4 TaxID=2908651 RepID=UPI001F4657C8|nr:helix-turn-helix domain-containing protein [Ornithinimicrobium sp. INDO-MA30-4]UJH69373.1 hypothetical protein L0A91_07985 [Ornithinimicrobium sp. INDO-MA30-4]
MLQALKDAGGPLTILDLAERLEVHPNTIRFHLTKLVEQAQAERVSEPHQVRGRPPQLFQIAPGMDPTGPRHYQALAAAFVHSVAAGPDPGAQALEVGRAWGRELASSPSTPAPKEPIEALVLMLNRVGLRPRVGSRRATFADRIAALPVPRVGHRAARGGLPVASGVDAGRGADLAGAR